MEVKYDADGYEELTEALQTLIDQYPGLSVGEKFGFSMLKNNGKSIFPTTGAIIQQEVESITGHVVQTCMYPFVVVYRVAGLSESKKATVKEWLDNLGRWLEKQTVVLKKGTYKLPEYPTLSGTREIRNIFRQSPAYLSTINEDKTEDWVINMAIQYRNEFDK